jgi:hypothetical protein
MTVLRLLAFAAMVTATSAAGADTSKIGRPPPFEAHLMQAIFDAAAIDPKGLDPAAIESGLTSQYLAFVGREDIAQTRRPGHDRKAPCKALERDGAVVDPITEIVARAAAHRVVMINERHDRPQDRMFIGDELAALNAQGFSIYAAETFWMEVFTNAGPAPKLNDGYYSKEPMFGKIVRAARRMNMTLVAYEHARPNALRGLNARFSMPVWDPVPPAEQARQADIREKTQARNLIDRTLKTSASSKVLVHAGYGHIQERASTDPQGNVFKPMALYFSEFSGVDPFTIDQTQAVSPSDKPVVCDVPKKIQSMWGRDMAIALPTVLFERQRPTYQVQRGARHVEVPSELRDSEKWTIVEARYTDEPDDAVPADRLLLRPGENIPLVLKPGAYRIEGWTREDGWTAAAPTTVEE